MSDSAAPGNLLDRETSPYLRQHMDNPVHWQPWGAAALRRAQKENKPILLSVGYAACHWCHVMAHESFENEKTSAIMNDLFVSIKVDREERPDLDAIYQHALAFLGGHGGWPLTMFLTPKGEPFWGGTYFPPESKFGRPGFRDVLAGIAKVFREEPDKVRQNVAGLSQALDSLSKNHGGGPISAAAVDAAAAALLGTVDTVHGGVNGAPKFPQPPIFEFLWRAYRRMGDSKYRDAVTVTLDHICQGGIYDHLGGGFARYSVDAQWLVPHFEKMLYDNALLIDLLTLVWQETRSPLYAARVRETAAWALREMSCDEGGFAAALDADSEGEEGKFYVWTAADIGQLLGQDAAAFMRAYDVRTAGNWEGNTILNRLHRLEPGDAEEEAKLADSRRILLQARAGRVRPGRDDKVLADWNGLMIAALANAGTVFKTPAWVDAAAGAFAFVRDRMTEGARLRHSWCAGRPDHPATLDDYANMCRAALALHETTGESDYLAQTESWLEVVERHYRHADSAGYFLSADDVDDLITRTKTIHDAAAPAGNATLAAVLARLYYLTGKPQYGERAEQLIAAFSGELARNPLAITSLLNSNVLFTRAVQIVICGPPDDEGARALLEAVRGASLPDRVLQLVPPGAELPPGHPASAMVRRAGAATAYVCRGPTCSLPLTDPEALAAELAKG